MKKGETYQISIDGKLYPINDAPETANEYRNRAFKEQTEVIMASAISIGPITISEIILNYLVDLPNFYEQAIVYTNVALIIAVALLSLKNLSRAHTFNNIADHIDS